MDASTEQFRIENKRFEKNIQLFKILAAIIAVLAVFRVVSNPEIFSGTGTMLDFGTLLLPIVIFFEYRRKAKNWGGQFIEVSDTELSFKTRKNEQTTVQLNSITDIEIKLDQIVLQTADAGEQTIIVEDFTEYSDRMTIKNNFTELKKKLSLR
ncbi:MAG: hypothetical protein ABJ313_15785 [Cyclobacteriaceae bacterium]